MSETMLAVQLYTVREATSTAEGLTEAMKKISRMGYGGVQLWTDMIPMSAQEFKRIADGEGLAVCATHLGYDRLRDEPEAVIEEHLIWDCLYPGIGGMPKEYRSTEGFASFAREASEVGRRLAAGGLKAVVYHNHSFEMEKFDGRTGLEILLAESDPQFFLHEIDTYWIQHGGGDPAAWIRRFKGRLPRVHLKDMANRGGQQLMAEVGEGNLNWPEIIAACREAGTSCYIVEQDTCERDPFESLAISLRNMKEMGL